jgi:cytochrome c oxidase subunit 2
MTMPRRSGPSPALILVVSGALAIGVFLLILAFQIPKGTPPDQFLPAMAAQLSDVWQSFFPPTPVTTQAQATHDLYTIVFGVAVVIFLFVEALIVIAVVRFRRKPGQTELPPQIHGNNTLEIVWTVVPAAIVAVLFFLSWQTLNTVDAVNAPASDVRIRVLAARFQWTFDYLDQTGTTVEFTQYTPEMVVPAGETIHLTLRSSDVNHAFYVPQFLFKRDVIPGRENSFDFKVDANLAGQTFHGQCAELCGAQHWAMQFSVKAVTPADYKVWLDQQIAAAAQPSPSPAAPSAAPSGGASAAPSGGASAAPSGGASAAPSGVTLELTAHNIAYDKSSLDAPAGQPFSIDFTNDDASVPHNVAIKDATGTEVFKGDIFPGVDSRVYSVPALPAGTYTFVCSVHPNMTGTLTVK